VLPGVIDRLSGAPVDQQDAVVLTRLAAGTNADAAIDALTKLGYTASPPIPVPDVANLASVRSLPMLLAGFLTLLALGAVGHALLTGSKRRASELAILRALGLTPRQAGACIGWQAAVVAIVGVVVGVPLGLALGRVIWRTVADAVPVVYVRPFTPWALLAIPATVTLVGALSLLPARTAARLPTAQTLHAE
jgi:ABC-type lipoprotein release transport system permease subunit